MRQRFVCLAGMLIAAVSALGAQSAPTPTIFGIHGGLSYSTISGGDGSASSRASFVIGAYMDQKLDPQWSFQPEVQYIEKGAKSTTDGFTADIKLKYVEVPVLIRYNGAQTASGVRPFAQLGPEIAFNTGCDLSGSNGGVSASTSCDNPDVNLKIESVDFGAIGGVGVDMNVGGRVVTATARYDLGLKKLASDGNAKNRSFTLLVGLRF